MNWNFEATANSEEAVLYSLWFDALEKAIYDDEFGEWKDQLIYPRERLTLQHLQHDTAFSFYDNIHTTIHETMQDIIQTSFDKMCNEASLKAKTWYEFKHTSIEHLSKIPAFSIQDIYIGGGHGMVNAASAHSGPSWRMIVEFTQPITAFGICAGGQSGNVGSKFSTNMIFDWSRGQYYQLQFAHQPSDIQ